MKNQCFIKSMVIKFLPFIFFFTLSVVDIYAQVTIGSGEPPAKAALLELKDKEPEDDNITSKSGGLLLPRVGLENKTTLMPFIADDQNFKNNTNKIKDKHTGLVVYNLTNSFEKDLCPGTYEWTGSYWERLSKPCVFFEFDCSSVTASNFYHNANTAFKTEFTIRYNSGLQKTLSNTIIHSYSNGLSIIVEPQTISKGDNLLFTFYVSGDGTTPPGIHTLSLSELQDKLGIKLSSICSITVNVSIPVLDIFCTNATASATMGVPMNTTVNVYYSINRYPYTLLPGNIGQEVNGITPSIAASQTLTASTGVITVTLKGTPIGSGKISVPITIGNLTCSIEVNVGVPFEFICSSLATGQYIENEHTAFNKTNEIKYNSTFQKSITQSVIHSYSNGLSITVPVQTINQGTDQPFTFLVSGDGTTPRGIHVLSLSDLAGKLGFDIPSSCLISVIISAPQLNLYCSTASTTAEMDVDMDKVVNVPYTVDRIPYTIPAGNIGQPVNGITPSIETSQTLTSYSGNIAVTLKGRPENAGKTPIPIIIGPTTCNIDVNINPPFTMACSDIYITGFVKQDMSDTSPSVQVPYTMNHGSYDLPAGIIGTHHGVTARVEAQTLTAGAGYINVKFEGTPIQSLDKIPFSIDIQGNSCHIYLSVINPPTVCPDGKVAKAFVFQQDSKWYILSPYGTYNASGVYESVALVIECSTEEEALRHPDALQYCGDITDSRCIRLFDRRGAFVANTYMTQRSASWYNNTGILEAGTGCWSSITAYSKSKITCTSFKTGNLGAVGVSGGTGYMGITSKTATMTDKPLR